MSRVARLVCVRRLPADGAASPRSHLATPGVNEKVCVRQGGACVALRYNYGLRSSSGSSSSSSSSVEHPRATIVLPYDDLMFIEPGP